MKGETMFRKFYGETEEMQKALLKKRLIITAILTVIGLPAGFINVGFMFFGLSAALLFIWGLSTAKVLFRISSFISFFSSNFMFAVVLFAISLIISPVVGLLSFIIGTCRFIYLVAKGKQ